MGLLNSLFINPDCTENKSFIDNYGKSNGNFSNGLGVEELVTEEEFLIEEEHVTKVELVTEEELVMEKKLVIEEKLKIEEKIKTEDLEGFE